MRNFHFFDVGHFVKSAAKSRLPRRRVRRLASTIFASVLCPFSEQHSISIDVEVWLTGMLPQDLKLRFIRVCPRQTRYFAAVYHVFKPWSKSLPFGCHFGGLIPLCFCTRIPLSFVEGCSLGRSGWS